MHHFKSFSRVKSTQDQKVHFIKGNELKLTRVELLLFFLFLRMYDVENYCKVRNLKEARPT